MSSPALRIQFLAGSLRCFACGWLSLLPLLGLPFGIASVVFFCRVQQLTDGERNPAHRYLLCGLVLGVLGVALSCLLALFIMALLINRFLCGDNDVTL